MWKPEEVPIETLQIGDVLEEGEFDYTYVARRQNTDDFPITIGCHLSENPSIGYS